MHYRVRNSFAVCERLVLQPNATGIVHHTSVSLLSVHPCRVLFRMLLPRDGYTTRSKRQLNFKFRTLRLQYCMYHYHTKC